MLERYNKAVNSSDGKKKRNLHTEMFLMRHANNANNVVIFCNGDIRFSIYSCWSKYYVLVLVCMETRRFSVQTLLLKINDIIVHS